MTKINVRELADAGKVSFGKIRRASAFKYAGGIFIKPANSVARGYAMHLATGQLRHFEKETLVRPVNNLEVIVRG